MQIDIIFSEKDRIVCRGTANDVLNAEGELQRLARFWQIQQKLELENELETCVCRKCGKDLRCEEMHGVGAPHVESLCGFCV